MSEHTFRVDLQEDGRTAKSIELRLAGQYQPCQHGDLAAVISQQHQLIARLSALLERREPGTVVTVTRSVPVKVVEVREVIKQVRVVEEVVKYVDSRYQLQEQAKCQGLLAEKYRKLQQQLCSLRQLLLASGQTVPRPTEEEPAQSQSTGELQGLRNQLQKALTLLYHYQCLAPEDCEKESLSQTAWLRTQLIDSNLARSKLEHQLEALCQPNPGERNLPETQQIPAASQDLKCEAQELYVLRQQNKRLRDQNHRLRSAVLALGSKEDRSRVVCELIAADCELSRLWLLVQRYFQDNFKSLSEQPNIGQSHLEMSPLFIDKSLSALFQTLKSKTIQCSHSKQQLQRLQSAFSKLPLNLQSALLEEDSLKLELRNLTTAANLLREQSAVQTFHILEEEGVMSDQEEEGDIYLPVVTQHEQSKLDQIGQELQQLADGIFNSYDIGGKSGRRQVSQREDEESLLPRVQCVLDAIGRQDQNLPSRFMNDLFYRASVFTLNSARNDNQIER